MNKELNKWFYRINSQEYEVEKLDPRTKRWVKIGKVSGDKRPLTFDVTGLEEGQEYDFRVTAINAEGESEALTTDCAIKAKNPFGRRMHACMLRWKPGSTVGKYNSVARFQNLLLDRIMQNRCCCCMDKGFRKYVGSLARSSYFNLETSALIVHLLSCMAGVMAQSTIARFLLEHDNL